MFGKRSKAAAPNIVPNAVPDGCRGIVRAAILSAAGSEESFLRTICDVRFACPGLPEVTTPFSTTTTWTGTPAEGANAYLEEETEARHKAEMIDEAAPYIMALCATCPLGAAGKQRQEAEAIRAAHDDLETQLRIAEQQRFAAEAQLELARLQTANPQPALPPADAQ